MKKILIVSEVFWPENFVVNDLVEHLKKEGYKVDILTQYPSYPYGKVYDGYKNNGLYNEEWNGSTIFRYKVVEGYRDSSIKKILNYIYFVYKGKIIARKISEKYDTVFVSQTGPLTVALPGRAYAKKNKCKLYIWVQDIWPDAVYAYGFKKNRILSLLLNRFISGVYAKCDKIFISSRKFSEIIGKYSEKETLYMPNWLVTTNDTISTIELDKSKFNLTFTGNISLYQNLENVIKGYKLANTKDTVLNIVGDGSYLDNLKKLVDNENIPNVIFHGRHPVSEMNDILMKSDALILSLISDEGIQKTEPLKLQSYLRAGKPILGVIGGSGKEIIEENKLGLCANPDNILDIAANIKDIIAYAKINSDTVSINAKRLMSTRFNRNVIIEDFINQL